MRRVAIVGSGISGLSVAHALAGRAEVSLFEAGDYFGGHTHTVNVEVDTPRGCVRHGVDTGFLVFNERTYPQLIRLFGELQVTTAACDMSFSVNLPGAGPAGLEWSGSSLRSVFAQPRNLAQPAFLRMLAEVLRFNRLCTRIAAQGNDTASLGQSIGDFLDEHRFATSFRDWYFLPMIGSIWSCPTDQMLRFPVATMIRFCHNHGLLQVTGRPRWFTVAGGARQYVDKILARIGDARLNTPVRRVWRQAPGGTGGAVVATDAGTERFDDVVLACHSDQFLALLGAHATPDERTVLGAIRYHRNRAVLHTDTALLPRRRAAWAAWNYERAADLDREQSAVCLHYLINKLQPLPFDTPVLVSLNPVREPRADTVQGDYDYAHPVFDAAAIAAQKRLPEIQGRGGLWFCGAWTRYGFHEDGLMSGLAVAESLMSQRQDAPAENRVPA